jgi:O-antigen/teichoic acid export membrane protein
MLGPILLNGISFFTIPIFTRLLGAENYGVYTIYASYQGLLLILMSLQTQAAIAPTSIYYNGKERDKCLSNTLSITLTSCVVCSVLILACLPWIVKATGLSVAMIVVMLLHTVGMAGTQWALAKFAYDKQAKSNFIWSTTVALLGVGLSLLFILVWMKNQPSYFGYAMGHMLPYAIAGAGFFVYFLAKGRSFFNKEMWKFCLPLCLPLLFHGFSNVLLHQSDKIMVQKFIGSAEAGIYGFAVTFANVMNIIFNALNTSWVPFYHDDIREGRHDDLKRKTNNYVFLFSALTVGFVMAMPEVVKIFAQEEFWPSIRLIPLLVGGVYLVFMYSFPVNFEFYYRTTKNIAFGTTLASVCNVILNVFFVQRWGMVGAAVATMLSYGLLYAFHLFMAHSMKQPYHYPFKFFYVYMAAVGGMIALFYVIIDMPLIRWAIFAVAAVLLLLRVWKNKSIF